MSHSTTVSYDQKHAEWRISRALRTFTIAALLALPLLLGAAPAGMATSAALTTTHSPSHTLIVRLRFGGCPGSMTPC